MSRPLVTVPMDLLTATEIDWDIDWRGQPGAESTADTSQVIYNRFPRWVGALSLVQPPVIIGRWRALRWSAQGRAGIYRLPMIDPAIFDRTVVPQKMASSLGFGFPVGSDFLGDFSEQAVPTVSVATAAPAGAEVLRISVTDLDLVPTVGQIISADDWPMGVTDVSHEGGTTYVLGVQMPLRAPISAGASISLVGMGRFEVLTDMAGRGSYGLDRVSTPSIEFREVLTR